MTKAVIYTICFLALSLGCLFGSFYGLKKYCPVHDQAQIQAKASSNPAQSGATKGNLPQPAVAGKPAIQTGNPQSPGQVADQDLNRALEYICEMKSGELALAWFTLLLVIVTSGLIFTATSQEKMARTHERAYIFGGGPYGDRLKTAPPHDDGRFVDPKHYADKKRLTLQNYGRTPGTIYSVEYGFCPLKKFPRNKKASYIIDHAKDELPADVMKAVEFPSFVVPPTGAEYLSYRALTFSRKQYDGHVFIGRIRYLDVFGIKRYSTFKLHFTKDGYSNPIDDGYGDYD